MTYVRSGLHFKVVETSVLLDGKTSYPQSGNSNPKVPTRINVATVILEVPTSCSVATVILEAPTNKQRGNNNPTSFPKE